MQKRTAEEDFAVRCFICLEDYARNGVTKDWSFHKWFVDGVDWFIAREVLYLTTEFLKRDDYDEADRWIYDEIHSYRTFFVAKQAYKFVFALDDFPRLWNVNEKINVASEFAQWLKEAAKKAKRPEAVKR